MTLLAAVRLVRHLNRPATAEADPRRLAAAVTGPDVAHHVLDPEAVAGLDPLHATDLAEAVPVLRRQAAAGWILVLPVPGRLGGLRGPLPLNQAALAAGAAVVAVDGGLALVPAAVGPAVQWRVHPAQTPAATLSSYEAERALGEAVLRAGQVLARLEVAAGPGPGDLNAELDAGLGSAPGYPPRRRLAADRAARLLVACEYALDTDGASISSYESSSRRRELEAVRDAARDALVAAVRPPDPTT